MKGNRSVRECGTVLKKTATGDEFTWGLRFYKLLTECFQAWAIMDEKGDIAKSLEELQLSGIPMLDEVIYYKVDASNLPAQHRALETLLNQNEIKGNYTNDMGIQSGGLRANIGQNNINNSDINVSPLTPKPNVLTSTNRPINGYYNQSSRNAPNKLNNAIITEYDHLKQDYLDALYAAKVDPNKLMECQVCFQSFFESQRDELSKVLFGETYGQLSDKETEELIKAIEFGTNLNELLDRDSPNYNNKNDVSRTQKSVLELYKASYGDAPLKYKKIAEPNNPLMNEKSKYQLNKSDPKNYQDDYNYDPYNKPKQVNHKPIDKHKPYDQPKTDNYIYKSSNQIDQNKYNYKDGSLDLGLGPDINNTNQNAQQYESENRKLLSHQEKLKREIEDLKRRERQLMSQGEKTEEFRGEADPKLLIEEYHNKNKEYEMLRSKYKTLVQQLNDKAYMDYSNAKSDHHSIQRSIKENTTRIDSRYNNSIKPSYGSMRRVEVKESYLPSRRVPTTETVYLPTRRVGYGDTVYRSKSTYRSHYNY